MSDEYDKVRASIPLGVQVRVLEDMLEIERKEVRRLTKLLKKQQSLPKESYCHCVDIETLTPEARKMFDDIDKALERK